MVCGRSVDGICGSVHAAAPGRPRGLRTGPMRSVPSVHAAVAARPPEACDRPDAAVPLRRLERTFYSTTRCRAPRLRPIEWNRPECPRRRRRRLRTTLYARCPARAASDSGPARRPHLRALPRGPARPRPCAAGAFPGPCAAEAEAARISLYQPPECCGIGGSWNGPGSASAEGGD